MAYTEGGSLSRVATARSYGRDLAERVVWTFLQAFGAMLVVSGFFSVEGVTDLSNLQKAGVGGMAAVLALLKGVVAKSVGDKNSPSLP
jgi:hypothetical protein